jgi:hypothetical protein
MSIDLPTLLSVLGVVLTIVFFAVGYRQTIGARRERARAANKNISDTLLRRFTLELQFLAGPSEVNKILAGFAIDARVRISDIYSLGEIEALLLFRVVESDYISAEQRNDIIKRFEERFKQTPRSTSSREEPRNQNWLRSELWLAIASAATALVGTVFGFLFTSKFNGNFSTGALIAIFLSISGLIALTAAALILFVRLRENAASADEPEILVQSRGFNFERDFTEAARSENPTVASVPGNWADFSFISGDKRIAVDAKFDINRIPSFTVRESM